MAWSQLSSSLSVSTYSYLLPRNYKLVKFLGRGGYGDVLKCIKLDTKETVTVKVPRYSCSFVNEVGPFIH